MWRTVRYMLSCIVLTALAGTAQPVHAQNAATRQLAARLVNLQAEQNMHVLVLDLADTANRAVVDAWRPKLQQLPTAQQQRASQKLNAELKKFNEGNIRLLKAKNRQLSTQVLVPAYAKRFTADELRQIITFLESPTIKKYFSVNPQIADLLGQKLLEASRPDIEKRINAFDKRAVSILKARN